MANCISFLFSNINREWHGVTDTDQILERLGSATPTPFPTELLIHGYLHSCLRSDHNFYKTENLNTNGTDTANGKVKKEEGLPITETSFFQHKHHYSAQFYQQSSVISPTVT